VRPTSDVLALETMYFADEVRSAREELDSLPTEETFAERELDTARRLVESLTVPWTPQSYHDTYRSRVEDLIEQKRAGRAVVTEAERPKANVVNLMEALQASLERARTRSGPAADGSGSAVREAPAGEAGDGPARGEAGSRSDSGGDSRAAGGGRDEPADDAAGGAGSQASEQGLAAMSKADLLARAGELGIEGRSKMTKDQLVEAVKAATSPKRRGRKAS